MRLCIFLLMYCDSTKETQRFINRLHRRHNIASVQLCCTIGARLLHFSGQVIFWFTGNIQSDKNHSSKKTKTKQET